jgi:phosphoribosylformylglycinamidine synthase
MNVTILQFPGTNCEADTEFAFNKLGTKNTIVWHTEKEIPTNTDLIVIAGGFSYGDYLRSGAIAAKSPIMQAVISYANNGGKVLGICNGFQILLESGLLPGAMKRNENLHFISRFQNLKVVDNDNAFLNRLQNDDLVDIPLAHAEGNYFVEADTLTQMYANKQVLLKYASANGQEMNVNGSLDNIAGICNKNKNVFGLMPHPERAVDSTTNATDGVKMLEGFLS